MTDLKELIERLERATGPDRELDVLIDATLRVGLPHLPEWAWNNFPTWIPFGGGRTTVLHDDGSNTGLHWESAEFTGSTDAALALTERMLPGGWQEIVDNACLTLWRESHDDEGDEIGAGAPVSRFPLAILSALLRALQEQEK